MDTWMDYGYYILFIINMDNILLILPRNQFEIFNLAKGVQKGTDTLQPFIIDKLDNLRFFFSYN